ncbi:hypothetical protein ACOJIV_18165 [Haloarcula sp. AONF1]
MLAPIQLTWFFDHAPQWLGPALIFLGLEALLVGGIFDELPPTALGAVRQDQRRRAVSVLLGLGILFTAAVIQRYELLGAYAAYLLALGRAIEGVAAVKAYQRIETFLRSGQYPANLGTKIKYRLLGLLVLIVGGWLAIAILSADTTPSRTADRLRLLWTGLTLTFTTFGLYWHLGRSDVGLSRAVVAGFILCVCGAEIYGYATLAGEIGVTLAGALGYSSGFFVGVVAWLWR